jgi:hypothetical protein
MIPSRKYNIEIHEKMKKDISDNKTRSAVFRNVYVAYVWPISLLIEENIQRVIYEQTARN